MTDWTRPLSRPQRQRLAIAGCLRFAQSDPELYDEIADSGDLADHVVEAVDAALADREAS